MSACDDKQDEFLKNEYILNLNELIMTRNYVYKEKTYQKYKVTDLSVKKSNSYVRNIYEEDEKILTYKHGYPQFYTQIVFEKEKKGKKIIRTYITRLTTVYIYNYIIRNNNGNYKKKKNYFNQLLLCTIYF